MSVNVPTQFYTQDYWVQQTDRQWKSLLNELGKFNGNVKAQELVILAMLAFLMDKVDNGFIGFQAYKMDFITGNGGLLDQLQTIKTSFNNVIDGNGSKQDVVNALNAANMSLRIAYADPNLSPAFQNKLAGDLETALPDAGWTNVPFNVTINGYPRVIMIPQFETSSGAVNSVWNDWTGHSIFSTYSDPNAPKGTVWGGPSSGGSEPPAEAPQWSQYESQVVQPIQNALADIDTSENDQTPEPQTEAKYVMNSQKTEGGVFEQIIQNVAHAQQTTINAETKGS